MPSWLTTISSRAIASRTLCRAAFVEMPEGLRKHADKTYAIITVFSKPFPFQALLTALFIDQDFQCYMEQSSTDTYDSPGLA